jgi:hypothetical protein
MYGLKPVPFSLYFQPILLQIDPLRGNQRLADLPPAGWLVLLPVPLSAAVSWVVAHVSVWLTALLVLVFGERDWPWVWPTPAVPLFVVVGSMVGSSRARRCIPRLTRRLRTRRQGWILSLLTADQKRNGRSCFTRLGFNAWSLLLDRFSSIQ